VFRSPINLQTAIISPATLADLFLIETECDNRALLGNYAASSGFDPKYETDRLFRNVGKKLPLLAG